MESSGEPDTQPGPPPDVVTSCYHGNTGSVTIATDTPGGKAGRPDPLPPDTTQSQDSAAAEDSCYISVPFQVHDVLKTIMSCNQEQTEEEVVASLKQLLDLSENG